MSRFDFTGMPLLDLLRMRIGIDAEMTARGYTRTASSLAGELLERAVSVAYDGELMPIGARSVDVVASDGRRLQVKTRSLPRGKLQHWSFRDFDFDAAIVVAVDRPTFFIDWARELSSDEVRGLARPHQDGGWRLYMASTRGAGIDVTTSLQRALDGLI